MVCAIWWVRRDLRLGDNQALSEALKHADEVIPLFIIDPFFLNSQSISMKRITFLYSGLRKLDVDLRKIGSRLIIRRGEPLEVITQLTSEMTISRIYAEADFSRYARKRDSLVAKTFPLWLVGSP